MHGLVGANERKMTALKPRVSDLRNLLRLPQAVTNDLSTSQRRADSLDIAIPPSMKPCIQDHGSAHQQCLNQYTSTNINFYIMHIHRGTPSTFIPCTQRIPLPPTRPCNPSKSYLHPTPHKHESQITTSLRADAQAQSPFNTTRTSRTTT